MIRTAKYKTDNLLPVNVLCILCALTFVIPASGQGKKKIELVHARTLENGATKNSRRLLGDVLFKQGDILLYCDSAYLYTNNNLDAYGHVHIQQGDSLNLYGDVLKYNGNKKLAQLEKNIRLIDKDMTLTTDHMTYDVAKKTGTYFSGGTMTSKENTLTSETGYYFAESRMLAFKRKVELHNPQYTVKCDTLNYSTISRTAFFFGPTWIRSEQNTIYCENGFYDTGNDLAQFSRHANLMTGHQGLKGDSLYYNRKLGFGRALRHVTLTDSLQHLTITGDYSTHNQLTNVSYVTGHALLQQILKKDTLFLHADSLKATALVDTAAFKKLKEKRTAQRQSSRVERDSMPMIRTMYAYHRVKFHQPTIQGRCDSLVYTYQDSTMHLYLEPVLWSSDNQLSAQRIELVTGNGQIKLLKLFTAAFILSKEDSLRFNQVSGKNMTGYFTENQLSKIFVEGNGQTIYYAKEKNKLTGANKADCSNLLIYMKDNAVQRITLLNKPDGTMYPPNELDPKEMRLKGFKNQGSKRPKNKHDLFIW